MNKMLFLFFTQALPCSMEAIEANPSFKTDQCMGVLVGKFAVNYAVFDEKLASGKHRHV